MDCEGAGDALEGVVGDEPEAPGMRKGTKSLASLIESTGEPDEGSLPTSVDKSDATSSNTVLGSDSEKTNKLRMSSIKVCCAPGLRASIRQRRKAHTGT